MNRLSSALLPLALVAASLSAQPRLNELMAFNLVTATDPDLGAPGDWVELVNEGEESVALDAYALSDDPDDPGKWRFPTGTTLASQEHLVVWLDGEDHVGESLHAGFRLDSAGDTLLLSLALASEEWRGIDAAVFGLQRSDLSLARDPAGEWRSSIHPTPGAPNITAEPVPPPFIDPPFGRHAGPIEIRVTAPTGATVRFTTDGSIPTEESPVMPAVTTLQRTVALRARSYQPGRSSSAVTTAQHFIAEPMDLPIVGLVTDPRNLDDPATGLLASPEGRGRDWERPVQFALLPADGEFPRVVDAGLRLHGGVARQLEKKSFRVVFREEHSFDWFPLPEIGRGDHHTVGELVLRGGASDSFHLMSPLEATYVRDELLRRLGENLGHPQALGFFAAVYLDGQYQGLYNACERVDEPQLHRAFGSPDWDVVKGTLQAGSDQGTIEMIAGGPRAWRDLMEWAETTDFASPEAFAALNERIDTVSFADHCILNIFAQNEDWPHNNWVAARPRDEIDDMRWRFLLWDAEWSFGLNPQGHVSDTLAWALNPTLDPQAGEDAPPDLTRLLRALLATPEGRVLFLERMDRALSGALHPNHTRPALTAMAAEVRGEIPREIERLWHTDWPLDWQGEIAEMDRFLIHRPDFLRGAVAAHFELGGSMPLDLSARGNGEGLVFLDGDLIQPPLRGAVFLGTEVTLTAEPLEGSRFTAWGGSISSEAAEFTFTARRAMRPEIWATFEALEADTVP